MFLLARSFATYDAYPLLGRMFGHLFGWKTEKQQIAVFLERLLLP